MVLRMVRSDEGQVVEGEDRIERLPSVVKRTGVSQSTIRRLERGGKFPRRRHLTGFRSVGWLRSEVDAWLASREAV